MRDDGADETDVLIIGAGLVGCASAHYLAKERVECLVVDRGEMNREGSGTNAGSLHLQLRGPERLYSEDVLREFLPMKVEAARGWAGIEAELGCDLGLKLHGGLLIAETDAEFASLREIVEYERGHGFPVELLSTSELLRIAPHLSPLLKGAAYSSMEGSANTLLVGPAYARSAQSAGARFRLHTKVVATERLDGGGFLVTTSGGRIRAKRILNAAGPWAGALTRMVGVALPVTGRVIQVNVTERREPLLDQLVGHISGGLTMKQTTFGTFMVGGGWPATVDPTTGRSALDHGSVAGNLGVALRALPALRDVSLVRSWTGVIAHSLDRNGSRLQIFGELPGVRGYYVLAGGTLFTMGPLFARLATELLTTGTTSYPVSAHHPDRFGAPAN